MKKLLFAAIMLIIVSGCASTPYHGADPVLMDYSARMLSHGYSGYGYSQPTRMQTQCIQQGPWLNCY